MRLVVGRIGRPHGIHGAVTVEVRTDSPELRFAPGSVLVTDPGERGPLTVESARPQPGRLVLSFAGVADRAAAEALRGTLLVIDSAELEPSADPDEYHDSELIGLAVRTTAGAPVGTLTDVVHGPAGDLLVVTTADGGEALVPFVRELVPEVDVAGGVVLVDPPEGLLDL
ncbi:MAG: ribosome maturation factor RimM [Mycobacteriales bacterium]